MSQSNTRVSQHPRAYATDEERKQAQLESFRLYRQSQKGKDAICRYQQSPKGKKAMQRYHQSDKGQLALARANARYYRRDAPYRDQVQVLHDWLRDTGVMQKDLVSELGWSQSFLSGVCCGRICPSRERALILASHMGIDGEEWYRGFLDIKSSLD